MKSIFEKVKIQQKLNLPFVVYRKPNSKTLIGIFQKDDHLYFTEDFKKEAFVFAPFSGFPVIFPLEKSEVKFNTVYFDHEITDHDCLTNENPIERESFIKLVQKGVEVIKDGIFNKLVLSRTEAVHLSAFDLETVFERILHHYNHAFCYCWFHPKVGMWMGASPEKLFSAKEYKFQTMALAGTQPYAGTDVVFWKNKEREEQEFVTDFIVEKLKQESSEVSVSEAYTTRAGSLLHLRTDIEGVLHEDANLKNVIDILHPTPAVCGLPKDLAKAFIEASEGYDREFYAGYLGEMNYDYTTNEKSTDLYVNLRCMKIEHHTAHLFVGCGITRDSNPEAEWKETVNKTKTMKKIL
jgi:isochorismate synthase